MVGALRDLIVTFVEPSLFTSLSIFASIPAPRPIIVVTAAIPITIPRTACRLRPLLIIIDSLASVRRLLISHFDASSVILPSRIRIV